MNKIRNENYATAGRRHNMLLNKRKCKEFMHAATSSTITDRRDSKQSQAHKKLQESENTKERK